MADHVEIEESALDEVISAAEDIKHCLSVTYAHSQVLQNFVASAEWSGKHRDAFYSYLEILCKYHGKLYSISKKQVEALTNLKQYFNDFHAHTNVKQVRNL